MSHCRPLRLALPLAAISLALGCGPSLTGPRLTPPRLSLAVTPAGVEGAPGAPGSRLVRLTISHQGGRAVALSGCPKAPSVQMERFEDGKWREWYSYGLICLAIYTTQTIALSEGGRIETMVSPGPPGRYRFIVPVGPDAGAPEQELRSRTIDLP